MGNLEKALTRNTLLLPALSVVAGIMIQIQFHLNLWWGISFLLTAVTIYLIVLYNSDTPLKSYRLRNYHYIWLCFAFCGTGILTALLRAPDTNYALLPEENYTIEGSVLDVSEKTGGDSFLIKVHRISHFDIQYTYKNDFLLKVNHLGEGGQIMTGDLIKFRSKLSPIRNNPNSFQTGYQEMMNSKGIFYSASIHGNEFKILKHEKTLLYWSVVIRNRLEQSIENTHLDKATQNFLITILLGDRNYLDSSTRNIFADAGVSHILALSGMHIAIIGGMFLALLFPFNFYGRYKLRYIVATILIWIYAFVSGLAPSTIRACIMFTFMTIALISERKNAVLNALSGSVLLILIISPLTLFDIGFQLSIVCVGSLILFVNSINRFSHLNNPVLYRIMELLASTVVATTASWIVTCYHFHSFPLSFLPANIIILPLLPFYLVLSIIYIFICESGIDISILGKILDEIFNLLQRFLAWIGSDNVLEIPANIEHVMIWFVGLVLIAIYLHIYRWKPFSIIGSFCIVTCIILILIQKPQNSPGDFIVKNTYNSISLCVKQSVRESDRHFPRYCNSTLKISDKTILCLDSEIKDYSQIPLCDFLIIGGSFKGDEINIIKKANPGIIFIHPTVRRKKENNYIYKISRAGYDVYSLRHSGPYMHRH